MKRSLIVVAAVLPLVVVGSIAVWKVSTSDVRRIGAIGADSEPVALMWRGAWSADAKYVPGQVVSFKGSSYVAEQENGGSTPDPWCEDDCMWARMGQGTQGPQGPKGDAGLKGDTGPKGDPGAAGPQGPAGSGVTGYQVVSDARSFDANAAPGRYMHTATCPSGKRLLGGGFYVNGLILGGTQQSAPASGASTWSVFVDVAQIIANASPRELVVTAICANVT